LQQINRSSSEVEFGGFMVDEKKKDKKKLKVEDLEGMEVGKREAKKVKGGVRFICVKPNPQLYKN
jgi:hypothetical protein